jgi:hypothetical protein
MLALISASPTPPLLDLLSTDPVDILRAGYSGIKTLLQAQGRRTSAISEANNAGRIAAFGPGKT